MLITSNEIIYDGYLQIEEIDALNNNAVVKQRIWSGGKIICEIHGSGRYYALGDANKNITEYIDSSGNISAHYEYNPFGKITVSTGTMPSDFDFRFSSEYFDPETKLVYYNYRYYSPELGRWLSRDPIGEDGGWNLYGMVLNNLINLIENLGLKKNPLDSLLDWICGKPTPKSEFEKRLEDVKKQMKELKKRFRSLIQGKIMSMTEALTKLKNYHYRGDNKNPNILVVEYMFKIIQSEDCSKSSIDLANKILTDSELDILYEKLMDKLVEDVSQYLNEEYGKCCNKK